MEKHEFKPKEWVLVRDDDDEEWSLNVFSHVHGEYFYGLGCGWLQCIPFEGNEHLLGKKDAPEEKKTGGWKVGDKVEVQYCWDDKWYTGTIIEIDPDHTNFDGEEFPYRVAASCFHDSFKSSRWCSRGQLREPVEKPEEEEFKFGDWVEVLKDGEWTVGIVTEVDEDDEFATYHVNFPDDDGWYSKSKVRKHEKG